MSPDEIHANDQIWLTDWFRGYRERNLIAKNSIAISLALHPSIVGLWEKRQRPVPHNRLQALADAMGLLVQDLLDQCEILGNGYDYRRPVANPTLTRELDGADVVEVTPALSSIEVAAAPMPKPLRQTLLQQFGPPPHRTLVQERDTLSPSEYPLRWCESGHGSGVPRRHHHGPAASWAPGFMTLSEPSLPPYVKRSDAPVTAVFKLIERAEPAAAPAAPVHPAAGPAAPKPVEVKTVPMGPCSLCGERRPLFAPGKTAHEVSNELHLQKVAEAQEREERREQLRLADRADLHRGHLALGIACTCETVSA